MAAKKKMVRVDRASQRASAYCWRQVLGSALVCPSDLASVLRGAYDAGGAARLEGTRLGQDLTTAGPVALEEHWDHLRHDSGFSAVLWVSEWPRIDVPPHFLHALVFAPGKTIIESLRELAKFLVEFGEEDAGGIVAVRVG